MEAMCRPDDKEALEDDMRSWVRHWDEISMSVSDPSRSMLIFAGGSRGSPFNEPSHGGPMDDIVVIPHGWAMVAAIPNVDGWARSL
ncbi:hypothetical protein M405DRAFT_867967 [Rhizopogon salebrosus TDB-379]|nr:hypothetical protein M405DRAFT_867967 [Rhizopogon salebrosus TDB-379]